MGRGARHRRALCVAALAAAVLVTGTVHAAAQLLPIPETEEDDGSSTPTTVPPEEPTTTAPPPPPSEPAPPPAEPAPPPAPTPPTPADTGEGDGGGGRHVPPSAQQVIDSIPRTPANDNDPLVEGVALLVAAGMPEADAIRAVFGRFPILGPSHWSDDWYYPRWTGTRFRYHQGLDMFAAYGTPVAAPVDGVARIGNNALGGLTVRVVEPDGTYWYMAHLSGIAEGLVDGQPVTVGQVVGFVGDSGNARGGAPHLHFGVYPGGGDAAPTKPAVDAWVAEGAARVPELLAMLGTAAAAGPTGGAASPGAPASPAVAAAAAPAGPPSSALLWASAANPAGGALQVAEAAAAAASRRMDWDRRAFEQRALELGWEQSVDRALRLLGPLTAPVLRQTGEFLRAASAAGGA